MLDPVTTRSGRLRAFGVLVAWLAAAGAATLAGAVAVGAIGTGILPRAEQPLTPDEVESRLAEAGSAPTPTTTHTTSPPPTTSAPPASSPTPQPEVFSSQGGTVVARCSPGVEIVSTVPAQGYRLKDVEAEHGGQRVRFESGHTRVEVQVNCVAGKPTASTRSDS
jgi:hypothetical protein